MRPYRVLVVDDSAFMRKIISDLIEQDPNLKVEGTAQNGKEAIKRISELQPDLVTMDVEMPEMNGLEALKTIMANKPIPVIMLSGINEEGMRETIMALELGAFDFIRKPSMSTSSQDIHEVGKALREQINTAMQAKERREAREAAADKPVPSPAKLSPPASEPVKPSMKAEQSDKPRLDSANLSNRSAFIPKQEVRTTHSHETSTTVRPSEKPSTSKPSANKPDPRERLTGTERYEAPKTSSSLAKKSSDPNELSPVRDKRERATGPSRPPAVGEGAAVKGSTDLRSGKSADTPVPLRQENRVVGQRHSAGYTDIVAIGCSTGGPKALKTVLEMIPADFPAPIVIVQHMPPNFTHSLAQRLNSLCELQVVEAEDGMELKKGWAYIAPGGFHIGVKAVQGDGYRIALNKDELRNGHRPSADVLYESLQPLESLTRHLVLLTGMGSDGARVMKRLYDAGVTSTFAESEETCVVYGMPRSAVELKCVSNVLPLYEIAPKLVQVVK